MYSSLTVQDSLKEVGRRKVLSRLFSETKTIQLVRNPYSRFISYFENKLRRSPENKIRGNDKKGWEIGQKMILERIGGINKNRNSEAKALMDLQIVDLIPLIPKLWKKDLHLAPQYKTMIILNPFLTIKPQEVLKIEELNSDTEAKLGLDLSIRRNLTSYSKDLRAYYNEVSLNKIYELYKEDFQRYGYLKLL